MSAGAHQGVTFVVSLPRPVGSSAQPQAKAAGSLPEGARLDAVEVLAVDDNQDSLDILTSALPPTVLRKTTSGASAPGFRRTWRSRTTRRS